MIRNLLESRKNSLKTALIENDREYSYMELYHAAKRLSTIFESNSSELKDDCQETIALLIDDGFDYISAFYSVLMSGRTVMPLSVLLTKTELERQIEFSNAVLILSSSKYSYLLSDTLRAKTIFIKEEKTPLKTSTSGSIGRVSDTNSQQPFQALIQPRPKKDPDQTMLYLSTSATTGSSKIVRLSERNVYVSMMGYIEKMRFKKRDSRYLLAVPLCSAYGIMILTMCLKMGFTMVLPKMPFTADTFISTVKEHGITHYEGSTTILALLEYVSKRIKPSDIGTLRFLGIGGSKASKEAIEGVMREYKHLSILQGYGMTEAAPLITKHANVKQIRSASVGAAIKGVRLAIESHGMISSIPLKKGEILVQGENVMKGYYKNEIETQKALKNGYLYTGDIGYLDEDGYLYIVGRKKNIIIVRGHNVFAEEVEECIQNSGLIQVCRVYGEMDNNENEAVCMDIMRLDAPPIDNAQEIAKNDLQLINAIREYAKTHLAEYKHPKRIRIVESIERGVLGKLKR